MWDNHVLTKRNNKAVQISVDNADSDQPKCTTTNLQNWCLPMHVLIPLAQDPSLKKRTLQNIYMILEVVPIAWFIIYNGWFSIYIYMVFSCSNAELLMVTAAMTKLHMISHHGYLKKTAILLLFCGHKVTPSEFHTPLDRPNVALPWAIDQHYTTTMISIWMIDKAQIITDVKVRTGCSDVSMIWWCMCREFPASMHASPCLCWASVTWSALSKINPLYSELSASAINQLWDFMPLQLSPINWVQTIEERAIGFLPSRKRGRGSSKSTHFLYRSF